MADLSDLARELCERFPPHHQDDPCPGCYLARRFTELGVSTEWAVQAPHGGNPYKTTPYQSRPIAEAVAEQLGHSGIPAVAVSRDITPWREHSG